VKGCLRAVTRRGLLILDNSAIMRVHVLKEGWVGSFTCLLMDRSEKDWCFQSDRIEDTGSFMECFSGFIHSSKSCHFCDCFISDQELVRLRTPCSLDATAQPSLGHWLLSTGDPSFDVAKPDCDDDRDRDRHARTNLSCWNEYTVTSMVALKQFELAPRSTVTNQ
jgi:hypothetical protein